MIAVFVHTLKIPDHAEGDEIGVGQGGRGALFIGIRAVQSVGRWLSRNIFGSISTVLVPYVDHQSFVLGGEDEHNRTSSQSSNLQLYGSSGDDTRNAFLEKVECLL